MADERKTARAPRHSPTAGVDPTSRPASLRALVIDDEQNIRRTLAICLRQLGCEVEPVASGADAIEALRRRPFDLAFCDLRLRDESGLDLLPRLLAERASLDIIMITAYASVDSAVESMRLGAKDYLPKPFTPAQIRAFVERTMDRRALEHRLLEARERLERESPDAQLETASPRMREALEVLRRAAAHDVPVLLRGESGTGKGILAHALHGQSPRKDRRFAVVSCPALPEDLLGSEIFGHARGAFAAAQGDREGAIEAAEGGTLFLDEIGELPLALQAKILHFLEERRFERMGDARFRGADVRVIGASSRDLEADVKAARFREDLLYTLNVVEVRVPPLRERREDILPLAQAFLAFFSRQAKRASPQLSAAAKRTLLSWPWPGNVRELRNAIERALIVAPSDVLEPEAFPERMLVSSGAASLGGDCSLEDIEREHALRVLARTETLDQAARILEIDVTTLWRKRKRWGR
ncbi:MAG TPA: sigma-54 dependent transcriptional regulator [Anaeromyxobacteraceae bacterium]|nr:sigma-54 dependent transcriptional regulator [Anaeromyxobacteraceae bacterium]